MKTQLFAKRLKRLVPFWLKHLEQRIEAREFSIDTLRAYRWAVSRFLLGLGDQPITPDVILAWKADVIKNGYRVSSVNEMLSGIRSFFTVLVSAAKIPFNPVQAIRNVQRRSTPLRHSRQPLTDNEVRKLLAQPDRETVRGKRDYAILTLMLYTGARSVEVYRADLIDLEMQSGKLVLLVQGKSQLEKDAVLVLLGEAKTAMEAWLEVRGDQPGALFISVGYHNRKGRLSRTEMKRRIKEYFACAGVHDKRKTVHSLRHTAITNAIRHHAPFEKLRGMSRHATLAALMVYYHETDRIDDPAERYIDYGE
jgi:site-specific recombinase XerD